MKVIFVQPDFPYAKRTNELVEEVTGKLSIEGKASRVIIDVVDWGSPPVNNPVDCIDVLSDSVVKLYIRLKHFLKSEYHNWPRQQPKKFPPEAFDPQSAMEVLFRILLQWRDTQEWGSIPEDQDEEFLCIWNVHVAGRLERMQAPCDSKTSHWEEFMRVFAGGEYVPYFLVLFEFLWKFGDLGKLGLGNILGEIQESPHYRPLVAKDKPSETRR